MSIPTWHISMFRRTGALAVLVFALLVTAAAPAGTAFASSGALTDCSAGDPGCYKNHCDYGDKDCYRLHQDQQADQLSIAPAQAVLGASTTGQAPVAPLPIVHPRGIAEVHSGDEEDCDTVAGKDGPLCHGKVSSQ